jgi:hypothetical protein
VFVKKKSNTIYVIIFHIKKFGLIVTQMIYIYIYIYMDRNINQEETMDPFENLPLNFMYNLPTTITQIKIV